MNVSKVEDSETLLTIGDVATMTKLSVNTIRNFIKRNDIPFILLGNLYRFKKDDIKDWIEKGRNKRPTNSDVH